MGFHFFKNLSKSFKSTGNWIKHAAEDSFDFGKKTVGGGVRAIGHVLEGGTKAVGSAGKTLLNFTDGQITKVTDILGSPSFLLIAGGIVVVLLISSRR